MKLCCGLLEGVPWFWFATANKPVVVGWWGWIYGFHANVAVISRVVKIYFWLILA
jgi:hypothetical protein